jgi:hypothetical protein
MILVYYERAEPLAYPEPRDVRTQLHQRMCKLYNGKKVKTIPLSTEIVLKTLKFKSGPRPVLVYKVIIDNWEETREDNGLFNSNELVFCIDDMKNYDE